MKYNLYKARKIKMMQTGITVDDQCVQTYTELRMKRLHRFLIMKVNDDNTKIIIDHVGAREASFADFKELMPKDQCR